jgi:hypothetical protein
LGSNKGKPLTDSNFPMEKRVLWLFEVSTLEQLTNLEFQETSALFCLYKIWVNQNHSDKYIWQDSSRKGDMQILVRKENRLIVCYVGWTRTSGSFIHAHKCVTYDYHLEMNADYFKD